MVIVITNTKGGVGKSTLAVHFAVWLHDHGKRVALVDADEQSSSSQWIAEAEPAITVSTVNSPDNCLAAVQALRTDHEIVIGDGPGGLDNISRTLLLTADTAVVPITPSILDVRSVTQATTILRYAQEINDSRPTGLLVLNRMKKRDSISRDLEIAAPELGLPTAVSTVRDLQAYREAAQQGTVVTRLGKSRVEAASEMSLLCLELFGKELETSRIVTQPTVVRRVANG